MWEFGELTNEQLHNFKAIVSQGASSQWDEVYPNATIVDLFVCCVF